MLFMHGVTMKFIECVLFEILRWKALLNNIVINLLCGLKYLKGSSSHKLFPEIFMITEYVTQKNLLHFSRLQI